MNYQADVDLLVIGSDEVFNCLQSNPEVGYSLELFGKNSRAGKVVTYAASFGNTTLKRLEEFGKAQEVGECLKQLDEISVRDQNSFALVETLSGRTPEKHLDPVFLYDYTEEIAANPVRKPM